MLGIIDSFLNGRVLGHMKKDNNFTLNVSNIKDAAHTV